jgi:hypothetical protein
MLMAVINGAKDLQHRFRCFLLTEGLLFCDFLKEFPTSAKFGYNKKKSGILVKLVNFDDIRMIL